MSFLRKYKWSFELYNFFKKKQLEHNIPLYKKYGIKKKYYSSISSQDFEGIKGESILFDKVNARDILPEKDLFKTLPQHHQDSLLSWSENGYAVLENFYTADEVKAFNEEVERLISDKVVDWKYSSKRIMFAMHHSKIILDAGNAPKLKNILQLLMDKEVQLFQSINFISPSQQKTHSDSIHMTTFPYGNLIAVWIALEDITLDNGPLHYYPGSHKLPYVMNKDFDNVGSKWKLGEKDYGDYENKIQEVVQLHPELKKEVFLAKKGDLLIWHANLLHGGEPQLDPKTTRKSMVFHYYTNDAICYHEVTQRPTLKK